MEDVDGVLGSLARLLVAEDEVDPVAEPFRHVVGLQSLPVHQHKQAGVAAAPRRKVHVRHHLTRLTDTQIKP